MSSDLSIAQSQAHDLSPKLFVILDDRLTDVTQAVEHAIVWHCLRSILSQCGLVQTELAHEIRRSA